MVLSVVVLGLALISGPAVGALASIGEAEGWTPSLYLTELGAGTSSDFGSSVALEGETAIVGAPGASTAYVYERSSGLWRLVDVWAGGAGFGSSVALDSGVAAVGAPGDRAVSIFEAAGATWVKVEELRGYDYAGFGTALDVNEDTIVVGAPDAGTVEVFRRLASGWSHEATLLSPGPALFGASVAIDAGTIVVGAPYGAAYVYEAGVGGWALAQLLEGPTGSGLAVDIVGDLIAVGAPHSEVVSVYRGAGGTWMLEERLEHPGGLASRSQFGSAVAIGGDGATIAVGAPWDDASPAGSPESPTPPPQLLGIGLPAPGAVHTFQLEAGGWTHTAKLPAGGVAPGYRMGTSVALDAEGSLLLSGAPGEPGGPTWALDLLGVEYDITDTVHVFERIGSVVEGFQGAS